MKLSDRMTRERGLPYASYKVIIEFRHLNSTDPSGFYFNKAISFLNTKMKSKGTNLKVPHCWYRWGDEVVRYYMPNELRWTHEENVYTRVSWSGEVPDFPEEGLKKQIDLMKLNEVSEEFWFWFCYYLRIHPKANENVNEDTIQVWTEKLSGQKISFLDDFRDHALEFSVLIPEMTSYHELEKYIKEAIRDDMEFQASFSEFEDAVEGLDEFLQESKKKYRFGGFN